MQHHPAYSLVPLLMISDCWLLSPLILLLTYPAHAQFSDLHARYLGWYLRLVLNDTKDSKGFALY
jgi:hypothetical protein